MADLPTSLEGRNILFFSRGRGRGHAVPDAVIAESVQRCDPSLKIDFVSYGTGASTLRELGYRVIDLQLPDNNAFLATNIKATRVIARRRPYLVISHEEFSALPAAKVFGTSTMFITDFFTDPRDLLMNCLRYADETIFVDEAGVFAEPPFLRGPVHYVGPVLRSFEYGVADRTRARRELQIPVHGFVLAVLPGSWTEVEAPIARIVIDAFHRLERPDKVLIWVTGRDGDAIRSALANTGFHTVIKEYDSRIDRLIVSSDAVITKENRVTCKETNALGIPCIALTHSLNPFDDIWIKRLPGACLVEADRIDGEELARLLEKSAKEGSPSNKERTQDARKGAERAARIICDAALVAKRKLEVRSVESAAEKVKAASSPCLKTTLT